MHLDALLRRVVARFVLELSQIEIRTETSIDSCKKVEVKGGRQAERVVVSRQHLIQTFHEISSQQKNISRLQFFSYGLQKLPGDRRFEIPDGTAEEQDKH